MDIKIYIDTEDKGMESSILFVTFIKLVVDMAYFYHKN